LNVVKIHEIGETEGRLFLSLEYVDGGSLAQRLTGTPLPSRQAARLVAVVASAIEIALRQGLVHRDLKPASMLLQRLPLEDTKRAELPQNDGAPSCCMSLGGEFLLPKITDFGLAKQVEESSAQTRSGVIIGTPCYMAPEQATGRGVTNQPATDVYALGAILY